MREITAIGLDLAKHVIQVHGVGAKEVQSADFISASGHVPRKQAGHMEALDPSSSMSNSLAAKGPSTHDGRDPAEDH